MRKLELLEISVAREVSVCWTKECYVVANVDVCLRRFVLHRSGWKKEVLYCGERCCHE